MADGLWRYDGSTFTNFTTNFVGYVYEDKKGNIWTSSETVRGWALSRYDEKSLSDKKPTVTEIKSGTGIIKECFLEFWKPMMEVFGLALLACIVMMETPLRTLKISKLQTL